MYCSPVVSLHHVGLDLMGSRHGQGRGLVELSCCSIVERRQVKPAVRFNWMKILKSANRVILEHWKLNWWRIGPSHLTRKRVSLSERRWLMTNQRNWVSHLADYLYIQKLMMQPYCAESILWFSLAYANRHTYTFVIAVTRVEMKIIKMANHYLMAWPPTAPSCRTPLETLRSRRS